LIAAHFEDLQSPVLGNRVPRAHPRSRGKAGKPDELGKMVKLHEAENQIIIDYEIYTVGRTMPTSCCHHRDESGTVGKHPALSGSRSRMLLV